jgi:formylglycine-generating enzyme required for sulfatase activity
MLPVHGVDWFDAYAYAAWRGKRLPERSEWEKAAGALHGHQYPWGKTFQPANVNLSDRLVAVNDYPAGRSPYGCLQMAGNVEEWCADRVDQDGRTLRPVCGGSHESPRAGIVVKAGERREPASRELTCGFRCARDPE